LFSPKTVGTKECFCPLLNGNQYLDYFYPKVFPLKVLRSSFWLHSIFYTFLQRFSLFFFGVVSYIILVRALLTEQNAVWSLYLMILMIFETVKQGLLRNPTIKFLSLPQYANKKTKFNMRHFLSMYSSLLLPSSASYFLAPLFLLCSNRPTFSPFYGGALA
jgi:hypothetical protein